MTSIEELPEYLDYAQVAVILGVSKGTVNRYTRRKINPLPVLYLNPKAMKVPRISKEDLKQWIECLEDPRRDV